jgi:hypothetical protein
MSQWVNGKLHSLKNDLNRKHKKTQGDVMSKVLNRNQILGVRATADFVTKFDGLCDRLGYNRSEVIRYCLKRFFNEHYNNPENFTRARREMC